MWAKQQMFLGGVRQWFTKGVTNPYLQKWRQRGVRSLAGEFES